MHRVLKGIQRTVVNMLSLDQVSEKYQLLAVNYLFFMVYTTLESVFVNTLLYMLHHNITAVIQYRAVTFVAAAVSMHLAAYVGQRKNPRMVIRLGGGLYMLMYVLLFSAVNQMQVFFIPVAMLSGFGAGFYWVGHNILVSNYTTKTNRDVGIAIMGIIQGIMSLLVPVIAGFVISWMLGTAGYRVMFGVGMISVGIQVIIQRRLSPVDQAQHTSMAHLALKLVLKKASVQLMMAYEICRGIREGAFAFLLNMVLFEIITKESLVGLNTFLAGAAAIFGSWAYGRLVKPGTRGRFAVLAAVVLTVITLPLFFIMNAATVMAFTLISGIVTLFVIHSCSNTSFDVMTQNEMMRKCIGEIIAFREAALCTGRLLGLLVLLLFPHDQRGYVQAILVLTVAQLMTGLLILAEEKILHRKQRRYREERP